MKLRSSRLKKGRKIEISPYHGAVVAQRAKQQDAHKQRLLNQRRTIVELPFAWIKQGMGFRRWTVRGLDGTRTQWALLCTVLNLRKLYPFWKEEKRCLSP